MKRALVTDTPIGPLTLVEKDGALCELRFGDCRDEIPAEAAPLLEQAARELDEYFAGERTVFTVPLKPEGTEFQKRCWDALLQIPYGQTRTYAQQAAMIGQPKACRAVGDRKSVV